MKRRFGFGIADLEWLHPDNFGNEPIYCEALTNPDEVLCHGSDDEAYDSPAERRIRYETQAQRFLEGKPVFLLSASLRGPFDKVSGWTNPWRSKSDTRRRYHGREKSTVPKGGVKEIECDAVPDSSDSRREASETQPTGTRDSYTPLRYMDEDTFHRVQSWRENVIAESEPPPSSIQDSPYPEPTSADSRRETKHANRRQSGLTLDTLNNGESEPISPTPSKQNRTSVASRLRESRAAACKPGSKLGQKRPRSSFSPPLAALSDQVGTVPHAVQHDEEVDRLAGSSRPSAEGSNVPDKTAPTPQQQGASPTTDTAATNVPLGTGYATVDGAPPEPAEAATKLAEHDTSREGHRVETSGDLTRPPHKAGNENSQDQEEDEDSANTPSQIDGPTLVPSESLSGLEYDSFGHFSAENQSQDVIAEVFGSSRRLLWPKTQRNTGGDSFGTLGIGSPLRQESTHSRHSSDRRGSVPVNNATLPQDTVDPLQRDETVHEAAGDHRSVAINAEPPETRDVAAPEADPAVGAAKGQPESEVDDDAMSVTEQLQAEAQAAFGRNSSSEHHFQPISSCPAPQTQNPWTNDGPVPCPRSQSAEPQHEGVNQTACVRMTPSRTDQSPWCKTEDVVSGPLDISASLPYLGLSNMTLSSIASQALEQSVSQSTWAQGDSQMQQPEVRLFNPLSSPANSHVSPSANRLQDCVVPENRNKDSDMCNPPCPPQLCPPRPSTPEREQSGLPSPDFTLSVKSFRDFMTPSPAKRRRISAITNEERLHSTQVLVEATISNPWTKDPTTKPKKPNFNPRHSQKQQPQAKPPKRVSWAPLPSESTNDENMRTFSPCGAEPPLHMQEPSLPNSPSLRKERGKRGGLARPSRASSPPPSILSTSALPTENQKFGKHFAAVTAASNKRGGVSAGVRAATPQTSQRTQTSSSRTVEKSLLSSDSQQVCESPAMEVMAEAFLVADGRIQPHVGAVSDVDATGDAMVHGNEGEGKVAEPVDMEGVVYGGCEEGGEGGGGGEKGVSEAGVAFEEEIPGFAEEESPVDEVSAVMDNLHEFLGVNWDLEADLAKARAEQAQKSREYDDGMSRRAAGVSELMAVNIWD
ncbi:hypothetical protein VTH82DRAFT_308 [Thermothelomyces myriococcoides]